MTMNEFKSFASQFQDYLDEVLDLIYSKGEGNENIINYLKDVLLYNTKNGKKLRGALVVLTYSLYSKLNEGDSERFKREAYLIGWAVEILQASFLVLDDIMDDSHIRRGSPSWFIHQKKKGYGLLSINDGLHLFISATQLIYKVFENIPEQKEQCESLIKLFNEVSNITCIGQGLDGISSLLPCMEKIRDNNEEFFKEMTMSNNKQIMIYKTAMYTFYLPIAAGLILSGVKNEQIFIKTKSLSTQMGIYFQTQDDFLDAFGDKTTLGKDGNDIQEGKCTWLLCKALSLATDQQKRILAKNYGKSDEQSVERVKKIYKELNLEGEFQKFEEDVRNSIFASIKENCSLPKVKSDQSGQDGKTTEDFLPSGIFLLPMEYLFNRSK